LELLLVLWHVVFNWRVKKLAILASFRNHWATFRRRHPVGALPTATSLLFILLEPDNSKNHG
jgi:hypothetical protein